jgi:hypothetical protein
MVIEFRICDCFESACVPRKRTSQLQIQDQPDLMERKCREIQREVSGVTCVSGDLSYPIWSLIVQIRPVERRSST